jgi:hypothetical protein
MSDEIKKAQEEAQRMAQELGIYEILRNVATGGQNTQNSCEVDWSGCTIKFKERQKAGGTLADSISTIIGNTNAASDILVTSIIMLSGTILYRSMDDGKHVTHFRYGSWVEKLKLFSEQITATNERAKAEKAEQEKKAKLAPFAAISDDEFETEFNSTRY